MGNDAEGLEGPLLLHAGLKVGIQFCFVLLSLLTFHFFNAGLLSYSLYPREMCSSLQCVTAERRPHLPQNVVVAMVLFFLRLWGQDAISHRADT